MGLYILFKLFAFLIKVAFGVLIFSLGISLLVSGWIFAGIIKLCQVSWKRHQINKMHRDIEATTQTWRGETDYERGQRIQKRQTAQRESGA